MKILFVCIALFLVNGEILSSPQSGTSYQRKGAGGQGFQIKVVRQDSDRITGIQQDWGLEKKLTLNRRQQKHTGYGRYTLWVDHDEVTIDGQIHKITRRGNEFVLDNRTLHRGINRKVRPWLYVHRIHGDKIDITFEEGQKSHIPLYTGSSTIVNNPYSRPWNITGTASFSFKYDCWLVSNRWSRQGVYFDLNRQIEEEERWELVEGDVFVPGNGKEVSIPEIAASVRMTRFDPEALEAILEFLSRCYNDDSPFCPCFHDNANWDPTGPWIQDIAIATLGTRESCLPDGGQAFYQIQLGCDSPLQASIVAFEIESGVDYPNRSWWCSETISYWHRKAEIPYDGGYQGGLVFDWQLPHSGAIQNFYETDPRGRWIDGGSLDYDDFRPGENAPCPGAYIRITCLKPQVHLYTHSDYRGDEVAVEIGDSVADLGSLDNLISSIRFEEPDLTIHLYEEPHYRGRHIMLDTDTPDLSRLVEDWDNRISSAIVDPFWILFFRNTQHLGAVDSVSIGQNIPNLATIGWNNDISSIRIGRNGPGLLLCENINYGGGKMWFYATDGDLSDNNDNLPAGATWNNRTSSLKAAWRGNRIAHSMMINEMTLYRNRDGSVEQVEASILEGNSGGQITDRRVIEDLLPFTRQGIEFLDRSNRKIVGFGIDLDGGGNPIYDPDRLHDKMIQVCFYDRENYMGREVCVEVGNGYRDLSTVHFNDVIRSIKFKGKSLAVVLYDSAGYEGERLMLYSSDPDLSGRPNWNDRVSSLSVLSSLTLEPLTAIAPSRRIVPMHALKRVRRPEDIRLLDYHKKLQTLGGVLIRSSYSGVSPSALPNGAGRSWSFPKLEEDTEIVINLRDVYPVPIKGIDMKWEKDFIPTEYRIQWAGSDHQYHDAVMPKLTPVGGPGSQLMLLPSKIFFDESKAGMMVQYIKFLFPRGSFEEEAFLNNLRFIYDWGLDTDASENPIRE